MDIMISRKVPNYRRLADIFNDVEITTGIQTYLQIIKEGKITELGDPTSRTSKILTRKSL